MQAENGGIQDMENQGNERTLFPVNRVRICIDKYENLDVQGRLYFKMHRQEIRFWNCIELLLRIDHVFDEKCFPQAFQQKRTFGSHDICRGYTGRPKEMTSDAWVCAHRGELATFDVLVQTRCRTGWQGILWTMDSTEMVQFSSELELLKKITEEIGVGSDESLWNHF